MLLLIPYTYSTVKIHIYFSHPSKEKYPMLKRNKNPRPTPDATRERDLILQISILKVGKVHEICSNQKCYVAFVTNINNI